jgi:transcriptional regulator with XRE-family HTH domain
MINLKELGSRISLSFEAAKLKQKDVSELSGVHQSLISDFVNGKREPSLSQLDAMALVCGVPMFEWLRSKEDFGLLLKIKRLPAPLKAGIEAQIDRLIAAQEEMHRQTGEPIPGGQRTDLSPVSKKPAGGKNKGGK